MLNEPTLEKLRAMRLDGMATSWLEPQKAAAATFEILLNISMSSGWLLNW